MAPFLRSLLPLCISQFGHGQDLFLPARQSVQSAPKPHILFILIDDLGWSHVGWNRAEKTDEVHTPNLDSLAGEGVILDRHYAHKFCSPTRSAIQTGRSPIHVNVINASPNWVNKSDPVGGFSGIPRQMTGIAEVMKRAGYRTHIAGKWDVGMATPDHTPAGRGYESSLVYYQHSNDCWTFTIDECGGTPVKDLWNQHGDIAFPGKPAKAKSNVDECTYNDQNPDGTCVYEDQLFEDRVTSTIRSHNPSEPLFLFWSARTVHGALQPPDEEYNKFSFIDVKSRRQYSAMVSWIDGAVGRVVNELKVKGMYDNTLIIFTSDNGGALPVGNNYPHKGGKFSNWEGGIRVASFASGGFLPHAVRGTKSEALMAAWDWYATFAGLAGTDPTDAKAAKAGLPPHDSIDQWPVLSGSASSARTRLEIGSNEGGDHNRKKGATLVGGLIKPPYKLVLGTGPGETINYAGWTGPQSPNATGKPQYVDMEEVCGRTPSTGCLFDIFADPSETVNLASDHHRMFNEMLAEIDDIQDSVFSPHRGVTDDAACEKALGDYGGFWGPWLP